MSSPLFSKMRLAIGATVLVLVVAGVGAYMFFSADTDTEPEIQLTGTVTTSLAARGSLSPIALAYGTVASPAGRTLTIVMPHEGAIKNVAVRDGDVVRAGQEIVTIAIAPAAAAQFAQARSTLDFAKQDLTRIERMFAEKLATNDQLATARKALADAQAQFDQMTNTGADRADDILRAPFDGVVTGLAATVGDRPQMGAAIATVADRSNLIVQLGLEPSDAAMLTPGAAVKLSLSQGEESAFAGRLSSVGAAVDPTTHLVKAVVDVAPTSTMHLALGTTLVARIDLPARQGIVVPRGALLEDADGPYVFTVVGGKAHRQAVKIVVETDDRALVAESLAPGTRVIVTGNAALEDGVAIQEAKP